MSSTETANALLKINSRRARRMPEAEALDTLRRLGFGEGWKVRHSVSRDGRSETVVTDYERNTTREDGSPRYDRARVTATFTR